MRPSRIRDKKMRKKGVLIYLVIAVFALSAAFTSCDNNGNNDEITCTITSPKDGSEISIYDDLIIVVDATDNKGQIAMVTVYLDSIPYPTTGVSPYIATISSMLLTPGKQTIKALAVNKDGTKAESSISITIFEPKLLVGDKHKGGIIVYIDETGKHGLIAPSEDQSTEIQWGGSTYIGATGQGIGTGKSNTAKIVQAQGDGSYAAKLCDDLVLNGYNDWFLPSMSELRTLIQNSDLIGGFETYSIYWSSSEYDAYDARLWLVGVRPDEYRKHFTYRVRCIREF